MFTLTYEFKLKPTQSQIALFEDWLEQCRRVYNYALTERKDWIKSRSCQINACSLRSEYIIPVETPRPNYFNQCKGLTQAKKKYPKLGGVAAQVLRQALKRLENAFIAMWKRNNGFPRFKKPGRMRSFVFPQLGVDPIQKGKVKLPKLGWVKFYQSRQMPDSGRVKQAQIVKRASGWYVMLIVQWDVSLPQPIPHGEAIGIDVGLTSFIATSNGILVKRPRFFVDAERKLKLLQKRVSRKRIGSNNWKKAQKKVTSGYKLVYVGGACPRNYRVYKGDSMIGVIFQYITHWSNRVNSLQYAEALDAAVGLDNFMTMTGYFTATTEQPLTEEELLDKEFDSLTNDEWERLKRYVPEAKGLVAA